MILHEAGSVVEVSLWNIKMAFQLLCIIRKDVCPQGGGHSWRISESIQNNASVAAFYNCIKYLEAKRGKTAPGFFSCAKSGVA